MHMIKDLAKKDKPPNKGQLNYNYSMYTLRRKSPLKEDNLSIKNKMADTKVLIISTIPLTSNLYVGLHLRGCKGSVNC